MTDFLLLFIMGLAGGLLAGLIGIGGGVMYILVLPYLLIGMGFPEQEIVQYTIANSIFGTMFAALSGNIALIKRGEFYWREVAAIGVFGTISSIMVLHFVVNTPNYDKELFNYIVIALMIFIAIRTLQQSSRSSGEGDQKKVPIMSLGFIGIGAGSVSALSGLGGGTAIIPILNSGLKMSMHKAKAISLGVIFITAFSLSIFNLLESPMINFMNQNTGYIVWPLALMISLGVVIGSPLGVILARRLSNKLISYIFVLFVLVVIADKALQLI
ncbi:sulfite exporter TauE/SafE family protein [Roseivirga sp. E12]|uniref:sulfite exporter TauE/SafE family protein n=1 Tax=Roseivirga sp. E12 TaxID=2819237 RepID=UPI001ABC82A3|nr:sulfite exporter TauE/SafE family protein [Roseivirga sp. E12]MBO3700875.1 sulfite exporter TauE/SafE family protein [Roseivirga sp. E12]